MKNCAVVGWEEGASGQISSWLNYKISFFIHPENKFPYIDKKKAMKRPSRQFSIPEKGKYLGKTLICARNWPQELKKRKIKNVLILLSDNKKRLSNINKALLNNLNVLSAIHPSVTILGKTIIGKGVIIEPLSYVGYKVELGNGCWIKTKSSIDHHTVIKEAAHIGPNVITGGNCLVGKYSYVNLGSKLLNKVQVGDNSIIGAGSLVMKNIPKNKVAWGSPAEIKKNLKLFQK